jgi:SAM-dependent methyltransferase
MHGVRQIVRFNWPFYATASLALVVLLPIIGRLPLGIAILGLLYSAAGLAFLWVAGSLAVSWIVYDRSRLMRWNWIGDALGSRPRTWINIHAGLDESTPILRSLLTGSSGRVIDIFDPVEMTEPSIARARRLARNEIEAESVDFRHLPMPAETIDAALLLLSAHELRTDEARRALLAEIHRVLTPGGRVVVAEHLRDWANFVAFGPGFLHFHSRRTWTRCFARARFCIHAEFSITPFVRVFVLTRGV